MKRKSAFTIIECVISLALISLFLIVFAGIYMSTIKQRKLVEDTNDIYNASRLIVCSINSLSNNQVADLYKRYPNKTICFNMDESIEGIFELDREDTKNFKSKFSIDKEFDENLEMYIYKVEALVQKNSINDEPRIRLYREIIDEH